MRFHENVRDFAMERTYLRSPLIRLLLISSMMMVQACHRKEREFPANSNTLEPGRQVVLIVPEGFSGALKVVKDPDHGRKIRVQEGRIEIPFTSDGTFTVTDFRAFEDPQILGAQYSSGRILRVEPEGDLDLGEKAVWTIGSFRGTKYPHETMIYLVCAKEEKDKLSAGLR